MKRSLASNSILYAIKTFCSMVFPLITFPYISRVLLNTGVGTYNFSASIVSYFLLLATLGISTYGMRECAKVRDDSIAFGEIASELFTINVISSSVSIAILLVCLSFINAFEEYRTIIIIISLSIPLTTIGMEWIFNACEEYLYITIRNILFQVISIVLMFLFVRDVGDTWKYAIITVFSCYGMNLLNFFMVRKKYSIRLVLRKSMIRHLRPILTLFAAAIASQIYVNSDITILGLLKGDSDVGIYSAASKVYNLVRSLMSAFVTVVVPRLIYEKNNVGTEKYNKFWKKIKDINIAILFPASLGLIFMSDEVILLLSGETFSSAALPLRILSLAMIFSCFGGFIANTVLLIYSKEHILLLATMMGAILNLLLNCLIIPFWGYTGAAVTTLIAEMVVFFIQYYCANKVSGLNIINKNVFKSILGTIFMIFVLIIIHRIIENSTLRLFICACCGVVVYGLCLIIFKHDEALSTCRFVVDKYCRKNR